jgi:hypothetical protein
MRYDVITIGMHCSVFVWDAILLHGCVEEGNRNNEIDPVVRRRADSPGRQYRGLCANAAIGPESPPVPHSRFIRNAHHGR